MKSQPGVKLANGVLLTILALAFGLAYAQNPLYSANQNSYFLHGLKASGLGFLTNDWMANTVDPFPVFTWLVHFTSLTMPACAFYLYQALLLGIYSLGALGIACHAFEIEWASSRFLVSFLIFTGLHSAALTDLSLGLIGKNPTMLVEYGVAGQSLIAHELLPATFGVFLILSIYTFLHGKPFVAVLFSSVAAIFHSSYLLSAAVLTLMYAVIILKEERHLSKAFLTGLLSFALVLPVLLFIHGSFWPTSDETFRQSQSLLAHFRLPHHADPDKWLDKQAAGVIAIILLGMYVVRRKKVFPLVSMAFVAGLALTLIQVVSSNDTLALLFPWRISTWLVAISWALLVAAFTKAVFEKERWRAVLVMQPKALHTMIPLLIALLALYGGWKTYHQFVDGPFKDESAAMMHFVSSSAAPGQLYLVPTEMERFRLCTGVPILVDWKTHPYKDVEVIEWHRRLRMAEQFYKADNDSAGDILREIHDRYGITHVVMQNASPSLAPPDSHTIYRDVKYSVLEIGARPDRGKKQEVE